MGSSNGKSRTTATGSKRSSTKHKPAQVHQLTELHEQELWAQVKRSEGGCWEWEGSTDSHGYGLFIIAGSKLPAHRVAWVIDHDLAISSFQQLRRKCNNRACVRPTHLKKSTVKYDKWLKSHPNTGYYLIRPPVRGSTQIPRKQTIDALRGSHKELQDIKHILHTLTEALPTIRLEIAKSQRNTLSYFAEVKAMGEETNKNVVELHATLSRKINNLELIAPPTVELSTVEQPTPVSPETPKSNVFVLNVDEPEPEDDDMSAVLMSAFQAEMDGPEEPNDDDRQALQAAFDIALAEEGDPGKAVALFGQWLGAFRELTVHEPSLESTPQAFAREASAKRL